LWKGFFFMFPEIEFGPIHDVYYLLQSISIAISDPWSDFPSFLL
jgi:hypothetical protein